jgi:steroid 5-alpha reductase family enzyme
MQRGASSSSSSLLWPTLLLLLLLSVAADIPVAAFASTTITTTVVTFQRHHHHLTTKFLSSETTAASLRTRMSLRSKSRISPSAATTTTTTATATTGLRGGGGSSSSTRLPALPLHNAAPFWTSSKIFFGANALGWLVNVVAPHYHYHVDLLGTGAFALAAFPSWWNTINSAHDKRIQYSAAAVMTWSVKLASFLLYRILSNNKDNRLEKQLSNPKEAAGFWIISCLWGVVCSLPHTLGATNTESTGHPIAIKVGMAMFGAGLATETLADYQKWMFKQNYHSGEFCGVGVWSLSQHPNWFGNLLLWSGILVLNAPALIEPVSTKRGATLLHRAWGCRRLALALLGPAFMWTLFDAQATGKIFDESRQANLQKYGYGSDPAYTNYIDNTPLIIPNPLQWFRRSS